MKRREVGPEDVVRRVAHKHKSLRDKNAATILLIMSDVEALLEMASSHLASKEVGDQMRLGL
jgi:hypothetical protein